MEHIKTAKLTSNRSFRVRIWQVLFTLVLLTNLAMLLVQIFGQYEIFLYMNSWVTGTTSQSLFIAQFCTIHTKWPSLMWCVCGQCTYIRNTVSTIMVFTTHTTLFFFHSTLRAASIAHILNHDGPHSAGADFNSQLYIICGRVYCRVIMHPLYI